MASQVNIPQKSSSMGKLLPIAGAVVGGIYGGPTGAAAGMGVGSQVGGVLESNQPQATAVQRRMNQVQMPQAQEVNTRKAIDDARLALQDQPIEMQKQYMPMLTAAALRLNRNQGEV